MKKKWAMFGFAAGVIVLAAEFFALSHHDPLRTSARKQWKADAISQIEQKVRDPRWLESELLRVKQLSSVDSFEWFSENLILATNGDWLVSMSKCSKEPNRIHDIFIGRASDGKWYYSTYHFCVGKLVLKADEPPGGLGEFVRSYFLREFDGKSDECLDKTWPPGR